MNTETVTLTGRRVQEVRPQDCATRWGNEGLDVLSTPAILGIVEQTCVDVLTPTLEPGQMTVGVDVRMSHLAPAALGEPITYEIGVVRTGRNISVEFTVTDPAGTVLSTGSHRRAVISTASFLNRLSARSG